MNAQPPLKLTSEQRQRLRRALTRHERWSAYRKDNALQIETMTTDTLESAARALEIDIQATIDAEAVADHKPRPYAPDQVLALSERLERIRGDVVRPSDGELISAILTTISAKQEGRATENQWSVLQHLAAKYEQGDVNEIARKAAEKASAKLEKQEQALRNLEASVAAVAVPTFAPKPTPTNDAASQLAALIGQLAGQSLDLDSITALVDQKIAAAIAAQPRVRIQIADRAGEVRDVAGHQHPQFKNLAHAAAARMANGYAPNIWLAGPAGSGKTHAGHQLAEAMGLAFHLNGALSMPHELLGFIDAGGTYHRTPFRDAYEHGGVYMFDEVDGSDNSALLALNAALANGHATFPDMKIARHADSIILASANTWGLGATAEYVGRAKIDAAFLSRFPVRLDWQYDTALEIAISGNPAFAARVIAARAKAKAAGLKVLIDPRASQAGAALIGAGMTSDEAAALTYLANITPDQRRIVEA
jgi:hypothetical protein